MKNYAVHVNIFSTKILMEMECVKDFFKKQQLMIYVGFGRRKKVLKMNKIHESQEVTAEEMRDAMQEKLDWFEKSDDSVAVSFFVCLFFAGLFVAVNWIWG